MFSVTICHAKMVSSMANEFIVFPCGDVATRLNFAVPMRRYLRQTEHVICLMDKNLLYMWGPLANVGS